MTKTKTKTAVAIALVALSIVGTVAGFTIIVKRNSGGVKTLLNSAKKKLTGSPAVTTAPNQVPQTPIASQNLDFFKKGSVSGQEDYCMDCDSQKKESKADCIREFYSENGTAKSQDAACEFGCENGACKEDKC